MPPPDPRRLLLRLTVDARDEAEALVERDAVLPLLAPTAVATRTVVKPYPKFEDTWLLTLEMDPVGPVIAAFEALVALARPGWSGNIDPKEWDPWATWNREPGLVLLRPAVQWASLEVWIPPGG